MIPKIIHYCWFGRNPKPKLALKCIKSWKKYCPDYQIIEWNEDNFDISACPLYVRQAYEAKKWAFVTDYVRLKVVYEQGGIYLDTDVELIRSPQELLNYSSYFGFQGGPYIATGLGFGAEKHAHILRELMDDYNAIPFVLENGEYDLLPCPNRNTPVFIRHGMIPNNETQILEGNIRILSPEWLCPYSDWTGVMNRTLNTISIHWFCASWETETYKKEKEEFKKVYTIERHIRNIKELAYRIRYFPNRILLDVLGDEKYGALKEWLKVESK